METQFVTDGKGEKIAVIIGIDEYKRMLEALDEIEDIRSYDEDWPEIEKDLKAGKLKTLEEVKAKLNGGVAFDRMPIH